MLAECIAQGIGLWHSDDYGTPETSASVAEANAM
jgi:hypothetical protein